MLMARNEAATDLEKKVGSGKVLAESVGATCAAHANSYLLCKCICIVVDNSSCPHFYPLLQNKNKLNQATAFFLFKKVLKFQKWCKRCV